MPRVDVIAALANLSDRDLRARWERGESTRPNDLDEAIHWLIDDTSLDLRPVSTAEARADLFATDEEAQLVQAVVDRLGSMVDELGDVSAGHYVRRDDWPQLIDASRRAHDVMATGSPDSER